MASLSIFSIDFLGCLQLCSGPWSANRILSCTRTALVEVLFSARSILVNSRSKFLGGQQPHCQALFQVLWPCEPQGFIHWFIAYNPRPLAWLLILSVASLWLSRPARVRTQFILDWREATQPKNAFHSVKLSRGARPTLSAISALTGGTPDYRADLKQVFCPFFVISFQVRTRSCLCNSSFTEEEGP